ncbi:TPA: hypothetical protein ACJCRE_001906 [Neisseria meningitidis]|nr:hypothetical protein [Neisseria meningitidis]
MPSEPPFRRHFTHQNRKTAPKIIITGHNGKPDTKPNTAAKMPSEAVGATILIWGPLQGRITFLNHPFDSQINSAFACQKQNQRPLQNSPKSPKFPPRHLGDFS